MESLTTEFKVSFFRIILLIISLITLSVLSAIASEPASIQHTLLSALAYAISFFLGIIVSGLLLSIVNSIVKRNYGFSSIVKATANGFAFMFPFAVLAVFTDILFHWNSVQAITCAAIFTCVSVSSADLINLGGKKTPNFISSFIASAIFISLYLVLPFALQIVLNKINL